MKLQGSCVGRLVWSTRRWRTVIYSGQFLVRADDMPFFGSLLLSRANRLAGFRAALPYLQPL
jgi:hypothetical protein